MTDQKPCLPGCTDMIGPLRVGVDHTWECPNHSRFANSKCLPECPTIRQSGMPKHAPACPKAPKPPEAPKEFRFICRACGKEQCDGHATPFTTPAPAPEPRVAECGCPVGGSAGLVIHNKFCKPAPAPEAPEGYVAPSCQPGSACAESHKPDPEAPKVWDECSKGWHEWSYGKCLRCGKDILPKPAPAPEAPKERVPDPMCICGEPETPNVVHSTTGPCFRAPAPDPASEPCTCGESPSHQAGDHISAPAPEPKGSEEPDFEAAIHDAEIIVKRYDNPEYDWPDLNRCRALLALRAELAEKEQKLDFERKHFAEQWKLEEARFLAMLHRAEKAEATVIDLEKAIVDWETEPQYRVKNLNHLHTIAKDILVARAKARAKESQ